MNRIYVHKVHTFETLKWAIPQEMYLILVILVLLYYLMILLGCIDYEALNESMVVNYELGNMEKWLQSVLRYRPNICLEVFCKLIKLQCKWPEA